VTADPREKKATDDLSEDIGRGPGGSNDQNSIDAETLLRQVAALRAADGGDEHLIQLVRIVDSATWSTPVPMTIIISGNLIRGILVPSEVSAAFLDDALRRSSNKAIAELAEEGYDPAGADASDESVESSDLERARSFAKRIRRRPFKSLQARLRERNATALIAINEWYGTREHDKRLNALDVPGRYADPASAVRDVVYYAVGQRAITLAEAEVMVAGEWHPFPAPVRISIAHIGAWSIDSQ
jgi:hypothetical protein